MNLSELLQRPIMGMPLWLWAGVVGGGGIILAIYLKRRGGASTGALGQNTQQQSIDPNIDPYTGVPYTIESQINPATGLPAYYGGPGVDHNATSSPSATPAPAVDQHIPVDTWRPPQPYTFPSPTGQPGQVWNPQQMYAGPRYGGARGPTQATPWWPAMTDLDALAHGKGA